MSLLLPSKALVAEDGGSVRFDRMTAAPEPLGDGAGPVKAPEAVNLCLLLGQTLFNFGATAQRIKDSIAYLARHLGCKVDMLLSYDALLITVNDGESYRTRIDSSRRFAGLNILGLTRTSAWLRGLIGAQPNAAQLENALCAIRDTPPTHGVPIQAIAAGCAGWAFCVVNGGDPRSWLGSFLAAVAIFGIRRALAARNFNVHLTLFVIALVGSLLAALLTRVTQTMTPAIALVAPVLFLVPGVPMINGGVDIVRNHVTIGIARVGFTLAGLVALCLGVGLSIPLLPSHSVTHFSLRVPSEIVLVSIAGALAAGALACLNNGGLPLIALCALGGLTGRLVRALVSLAGIDLITASLAGVLCSTLVVSFIADRFSWPAVVASVMAALPLVPGYFAITGLQALLSFAAANSADPTQLSVGVHALSRAIFISVALVVGVIGPVITLQRDKERV
jgi:uncharacterized membrane protein YjjP (DUF1212 family)